LHGIQYGFDRDNRIQMERKEDMSKRGLASPDDADALALTFSEPIARADLALRRRRAAPAKTEYAILS
jgi:hypothetical protein